MRVVWRTKIQRCKGICPDWIGCLRTNTTTKTSCSRCSISNKLKISFSKRFQIRRSKKRIICPNLSPRTTETQGTFKIKTFTTSTVSDWIIGLLIALWLIRRLSQVRARLMISIFCKAALRSNNHQGHHHNWASRRYCKQSSDPDKSSWLIAYTSCAKNKRRKVKSSCEISRRSIRGLSN